MDLTTVRRAALAAIRSRRFWQASGLLITANAISSLLGVVRTPALAWLLPKEEVGMIGVVAAWSPFLNQLSLPGLDLAAHHFAAKGQPRAFVVGASHRLRWSLLSAAAFFGSAVYWWWRGDNLLAGLFVVAGAVFPLTAGLTGAARSLAAAERFLALSGFRVVSAIFTFAGFLPLVASVWYVSKSLTYYAANQLVAALLHLGVSIALVIRLDREAVSPLPPEVGRQVIEYGRHLTVIGAINIIQSRTDALLVGMLLPLETMAEYSIAMAAQTPLRQLWDVYISVRYPPLVRMAKPARRTRLLVEGAGVVGVLAAAGLVIWAGAHWLVPLLLPPTYLGSLRYVPWLLATVVAGTPGGLAEQYFRAEQDQRRLYKMRLSAALASVALPATMLALGWGIQGVLVGHLAANLLFSVIGAWLFARDAAVSE